MSLKRGTTFVVGPRSFVSKHTEHPVERNIIRSDQTLAHVDEAYYFGIYVDGAALNLVTYDQSGVVPHVMEGYPRGCITLGAGHADSYRALIGHDSVAFGDGKFMMAMYNQPSLPVTVGNVAYFSLSPCLKNCEQFSPRRTSTSDDTGGGPDRRNQYTGDLLEMVRP